MFLHMMAGVHITANIVTELNTQAALTLDLAGQKCGVESTLTLALKTMCTWVRSLCSCTIFLVSTMSWSSPYSRSSKPLISFISVRNAWFSAWLTSAFRDSIAWSWNCGHNKQLFQIQSEWFWCCCHKHGYYFWTHCYQFLFQIWCFMNWLCHHHQVAREDVSYSDRPTDRASLNPWVYPTDPSE